VKYHDSLRPAPQQPMPHVTWTCGLLTRQDGILLFVSALLRPGTQEVVLGVQDPGNNIIIIHLEQVPLYATSTHLLASS